MPDALGDVVLRSPAEQPLRAADAGIGTGDVTGPSAGLTHLDGVIGHLVERGEQLPDRGARAAAQVDGRHRPGQGVEPVQRGDMCSGQVPDVDVSRMPVPSRVGQSVPEIRNGTPCSRAWIILPRTFVGWRRCGPVRILGSAPTGLKYRKDSTRMG